MRPPGKHEMIPTWGAHFRLIPRLMLDERLQQFRVQGNRPARAIPGSWTFPRSGFA
jgi:hypothetical protein